MSTMVYRIVTWDELNKAEKASVRKACTDINKIDYIEACDYGNRQDLHVHLLPSEVMPNE